MKLASRFGSNAPVLRSETPLDDNQIRSVAPPIYADDKRADRSARYTYIPTATVLTALRREGFQPFMVCQTRVRDDAKREHTKHMLRLRHADQINGREANEIILLNSHDGTSSYQMLAGLFRFVCKNGLVCGDVVEDLRFPHKGDIVQDVIAGAQTVLDGFNLIRERRESFEAIELNVEERQVFARSALALKYDEAAGPAPVTESQLLAPRRTEDAKSDLWSVFNRVQENLTQGGLWGRSAKGRSIRTQPILGIDQNVKINRALWLLAAGMQAIKA